jgi:hypothetical protein
MTHRKIIRYNQVLVFCMLLLSTFVRGQQIKIVLKNNSEKETKGKEQLERIIKKFPDAIKMCITTDTVVIDEFTKIPHSHPVITLNTNYLWSDTAQLAMLLHEGLHWKVEAMPLQAEKAIEEFTRMFPEAPDKGPLGGQNLYSTYLHLVVCDLELQALEFAIGTIDARKRLRRKPFYKWIYEKVVNNQDVRSINLKYGFSLVK